MYHCLDPFPALLRRHSAAAAGTLPRRSSQSDGCSSYGDLTDVAGQARNILTAKLYTKHTCGGMGSCAEDCFVYMLDGQVMAAKRTLVTHGLTPNRTT